MHDDEIPRRQMQRTDPVRIRGELLMVFVAAAAMLTAVLVVEHLEEDRGALADTRGTHDAAARVGDTDARAEDGSGERERERPATDPGAVDP